MTVLGYSTQILFSLAPLVTNIVTIVNATAIVVLVVITGLHAYYTKKLANCSRACLVLSSLVLANSLEDSACSLEKQE